MDTNYCGKDCAVCAYRSECAGCHTMRHDCDIAQCCRQRGHATCDTCVTKERCGTLMKKDRKHEDRQAAVQRAVFMAQENEARAAVMAPVLWKIFWLLVISNVLSLVGFLPALERMGNIFGYVMSVIVGGLLLTLRDVDERFKTAGSCAIATALLDLAGTLIGTEGWVTVLSLVGAVFSLVAMYNELVTMGDIVGLVDVELGQSWKNLWKYRMIALAVTVGCTLLLFVAGALAALVLIAAAVAVLVLGIMQMVYYYKTAKLYDGMIAK